MRKLLIILCLSLLIPAFALAVVPNPGHAAYSVGPGTNGSFYNGNYVFPNSVNVTQNLTVVSNLCLGGVCYAGWPGSGNISGGAGAVTGNLAFFNNNTMVNGSSNLYWDAVNSRLSIAGDATPAAALTVGASDAFQVSSAGFTYMPDGTNSLPSLSFVSDTNTGLYSGGADILRLTTGGTNRITIDANGRVGINTTSPAYALDVNGSANVSIILYTPQLCLTGDCRTTWPSSGNVSSGNNISSGRFAFWNNGSMINGTTGVSYSYNPTEGGVITTGKVDTNFFLANQATITSLGIAGVGSSIAMVNEEDRSFVVTSNLTYFEYADNAIGRAFYASLDTGVLLIDEFNVGINVTNPGEKLSVGGNINATGTINAGAGVDLAEAFETVEPVEAGDIVAMVDRDRIRKATESEAYLSFGVVSTQPGFTLTKPGLQNASMIAIAGRVPVKVQGVVQRADFITASSTPGVGKAATEPTFVIGRALEDSVDGIVYVLIQPSYFSPQVDVNNDLLGGKQGRVFEVGLSVRESVETIDLASPVQERGEDRVIELGASDDFVITLG